MSTISFSVEDTLKRDVARWARNARKSKSDLFRDMAAVYGFNERLEDFTLKTEPILKTLGIKNETELCEYLNNDETYQDRLRHQRVSRSPKKR
ncbi:MAG: hypothetical protein V4702_05330 [Patescibacteria group bacterium]